MYSIQKVKQQIIQELKKAVGSGFSPSIEDFTFPPDPSLGDITFSCFSLAKSLKRNPNEIATEIAAKIGPKQFISEARAVGPYVNFIFSSEFGTDVLSEISDQEE